MQKGVAELLQYDYVYILENVFFHARSTLEQKHSIMALTEHAKDTNYTP